MRSGVRMLTAGLFLFATMIASLFAACHALFPAASGQELTVAAASLTFFGVLLLSPVIAKQPQVAAKGSIDTAPPVTAESSVPFDHWTDGDLVTLTTALRVYRLRNSPRLDRATRATDLQLMLDHELVRRSQLANNLKGQR